MNEDTLAVSGNDMFDGGGSDPAPEVDTSTGSVEAAPDDTPVEAEPQGEHDTVQVQEDLAQVQPATVAPQAPAPQHLPIDPRYLEMQAEAQKPVTEFFRFLNENAQKAEAAKAQQAARAQAQFRIQQMESMRPARPNPATATPDELLDYAAKNAEYMASRSRMEVMEEMRQTLGAELEQKLAPLKELQAKAMADEAARSEQYVSNAVEQFSLDPRYPFMRNPVIQNAFLRHWWATNAAQDGGTVSPQQAMQDFIAVQRAFSAPAPVKARADQQNLDANRRAIQQKNGAPAVPKATSPAGGARGTGKPGEMKAPDWLSGR